MSILAVGFKRLSDDAVIPTKAHAADSGFDLYAAEDTIIEPGETKVIPTGIAVELPEGYEAQVRPRSGVSAKTKLRVQLGTIDNSYTGEIGIIVDNYNCEDGDADCLGYYRAVDNRLTGIADESRVHGSYYVYKGDKLAQLVVQELPNVEAIEVDALRDTERGAGGFGSTGVREGD